MTRKAADRGAGALPEGLTPKPARRCRAATGRWHRARVCRSVSEGRDIAEGGHSDIPERKRMPWP